VPFWFGSEVPCSCCGLTNFIDPFEDAVIDQDAFSATVPTGIVVAMWGAGGIYYKLMQKYSALAAKHSVLVDADPTQQGLSIRGKMIHVPDIISRQGITSVVITALSRKKEIRADLCSAFPLVEHVLVPDFDLISGAVVPVLRHY